MKTNKKLIGSSILASVAASLCCITPVLALISGTSGIASTFSFMEPFRPYLIAITVLILSLAWYQKIKRDKNIACACEPIDSKNNELKSGKFLQSKSFLAIVTVFAALMLAFPYYAAVFFPKTEKQIVYIDKSDVQTIHLTISGMTCIGCAEHIDHEVNKLEGVVSSKASYENGDVFVQFDSSKTSIEEIEKTINATGYTVVNYN
ncbi:MAG: heavy metal transporter [Bacteroidetes bacterium HGW-Bacteroidetes-13]|nr:MAG: heavy metal transporter [Bacteroidetes bacterium HGW-Bacteroidetes-13]